MADSVRMRKQPRTDEEHSHTRQQRDRALEAGHLLDLRKQIGTGDIEGQARRQAQDGPDRETQHGLAGRSNQGGDAICMVSVDEAVPEEVLAMVRTLPLVMQATNLNF